MTLSVSALAHSPDAAPGAAPALLAVRQLRLTDFRNYRQLRLDCGPEPVVLVGPNGAGKTNLIEALSFLAPGRGLRRAGPDGVAGRPRAWTGGVAATLDPPRDGWPSVPVWSRRAAKAACRAGSCGSTAGRPAVRPRLACMSPPSG